MTPTVTTYHVATQLPNGQWHVLFGRALGFAEGRAMNVAELIEIIQAESALDEDKVSN
ncbi:hypothetical protein J2W42_002022 [Rhizobium tibeticum]|uniref:hypothetical protein n=1 Tax=Rhizobium tibeticum TaxID=501024 RepID=UPI002783CFAB|nr:hypothetical protein [Rhizobium tibeticum]MDP9809174.1 hypothetical protein [Rhizobium tibeticum]